MQIVHFLKCFVSFGWLQLNVTASSTALPFSPVKLVFLIGWVYMCLFLVQRIQYSSLMVNKYKTLINFTTLFAGPFVFLILGIIDVIHKSIVRKQSVIEVIKQQITKFIESIRSFELGSKKVPRIVLLDSSGRNIKEIYNFDKKSKRQESHILDQTEDMIYDALQERASDILIDPRDISTSTVRYRIDGILIVMDELKADMSQAVINSVKVVSGMDIAERRRPQDGAFTARTADMNASFRVSSAGVVNGEKLSIRVLNQDASRYRLTTVGITNKQKKIIEKAVAKPSGMILMCGPTGSGKTTTLYAMLNEIDLFARNVITVEDPIEYVLPDASQIEINTKADITFAKSLRSIFRQDPDVIVVGEIRDEETAVIALRAAQTGHLVMSTVHSNSNEATLVRLLDLGVSPIMMSTGLSLLINQRLLRKLCKYCKVPANLSENQKKKFSEKGINCDNIFQAQGCDYCHGTGYYGRVAICDIMELNSKMRADIANNDLLTVQLRKTGDKKGKSNMYKEGFRKVVTGITSLSELKRVVG